MLEEVVRIRSELNFSGLGIIFYTPPLSLPVVHLGNPVSFCDVLPMSDISNMSKFLADISELRSPWHDGFHLVDCSTYSLTHVSQFFSPPIRSLTETGEPCTPMGARQMAAILGSLLDSVEYIALLNIKAQASVFRRGKIVFKDN